MAGSFSVISSELSAGAQEVAGLGALTERTGAGLVEVLSGLAASAGDADLSGALQGADAAAAKAVGELVVLLGYVAGSLESCAANYSDADTSVAALILHQGIERGLVKFRPPTVDGPAEAVPEEVAAEDGAAASGEAVTEGGAVASEAAVDAGLVTLNASLDWIPVAGEVVIIGTGVYLAGDFLYHHWTPFRDAAKAVRSAEAQELIDRAQSEDVLLTLLSAMDLCALGGPRQALFDEAPAKAWAGMRRRGREHGPAAIFQELEHRGLLIRQAPAVPMAAPGKDREPGLAEYAFSPRLGLAMAARSRPTVAVTCEQARVPGRYPRLFGLGDEQDPVRAVVLEAPIRTPVGDFPNLQKAGPLAWFYRYDLVSRASAADFLARWALLRSKLHPDVPRLVTLLRHDQGTLLTVETLAVRTDDGKTARLGGTGSADGEQYDQAGLTRIMSGLFSPEH